MRFPVLKTKDLNGKSVTFPHDFKHDLNLLFVAYEQWQQAEVNSWVPFAKELKSQFPTLDYYELPVVGRLIGFGKLMLDHWMRQGIPDEETRGRTLTYYMDRTEFREALGIEHEDHIAIVLVDRDGTVLWLDYGSFAQESADSLCTIINQQLTPVAT